MELPVYFSSLNIIKLTNLPIVLDVLLKRKLNESKNEMIQRISVSKWNLESIVSIHEAGRRFNETPRESEKDHFPTSKHSNMFISSLATILTAALKLQSWLAFSEIKSHDAHYQVRERQTEIKTSF